MFRYSFHHRSNRGESCRYYWGTLKSGNLPFEQCVDRKSSAANVRTIKQKTLPSLPLIFVDIIMKF